MIDVEDIVLSSIQLDGAVSTEPTYKEMSLADLEKEYIEATLDHTDWNKSQAATILGIERSTLDRKIKAYEITK